MITIYKGDQKIITLTNFQSFIRYMGTRKFLKSIDEGFRIENAEV